MTGDLFPDASSGPETPVALAEGAVLLRGFALADAPALMAGVEAVAAASLLRRLSVPGGGVMSVAMTACGATGWTSDARGYRYSPVDPDSGRPWPPMPPVFAALARAAAAEAGHDGFSPDTCLVNRYEAGARMGLHQDRDEADMRQPIVSASLGAPAVFLFGGPARRDRVRRIPLRHGDVVVWGGRARLAYHGVAPLKAAAHPLTGPLRFNLTFRRAL